MAFLLAMLLFSLAGIPPLAGFFAKFYVFLAAIDAGLYALAVIGVLLSVVGAYYYLRIVKIMYFDAPAERFEPMPGLLAAVLGVSGLFILFYFVYPAPLVSVAEAAAKSCSDAACRLGPKVPAGYRLLALETVGLDQRRSARAAARPASRRLCGSGRGGSPPAVAAAGGNGSPGTAICSRACSDRSRCRCGRPRSSRFIAGVVAHRRRRQSYWPRRPRRPPLPQMAERCAARRRPRSQACWSKARAPAAEPLQAVVIGTGINLASHPAGLDHASDEPRRAMAVPSTPAAAFETLAAVPMPG